MSLPRQIYYVLIGCATTSLFCVLFLNSSSPNAMIQGNVKSLSRNYQYEEICKEWKSAVETDDNQTTGSTDIEPVYKVDEYDDELKSLFTCDDSPKYKYLSQRGNFYIIYNLVAAEREFACTESITLTSPGDYRFLDNVILLVDRWQGPISIALYSPGHDFDTTKRSIAYLRQCENSLIKELVSFHVFFDIDHIPKRQDDTPLIDSYEDKYNCSLPPPWESEAEENMYKRNKSLLYPINIARNVARQAAKTYFVFPSDIELYPTRNFIKLFFDFVRQNLKLFGKDSRNVFVLPIFEILENQNIPENKTQLQWMLEKKTALVFHQRLCMVCHRVIDSQDWIKSDETPGLGIFSSGKREGKYMVWEPFFVCTQKEPMWDERFTWEGQQNKMVQAYTMCVMDYDFHVFDNAFLIHKPGVKKNKVQMLKHNNNVMKTVHLIKTVAHEIQEMYGYRSSCSTTYNKSLLNKINRR